MIIKKLNLKSPSNTEQFFPTQMCKRGHSNDLNKHDSSEEKFSHILWWKLPFPPTPTPYPPCCRRVILSFQLSVLHSQSSRSSTPHWAGRVQGEHPFSCPGQAEQSPASGEEGTGQTGDRTSNALVTFSFLGWVERMMISLCQLYLFCLYEITRYILNKRTEVAERIKELRLRRRK
jgi:hypothetical protein